VNEHDLDAYITAMIDRDSAEMLELTRGGANYGTAKSSEVVGVVVERVSTDCVSGENVLQN